MNVRWDVPMVGGRASESRDTHLLSDKTLDAASLLHPSATLALEAQDRVERVRAIEPRSDVRAELQSDAA